VCSRHVAWLCGGDASQYEGYVASFELRDPGVFTLQVQLGTFFGDSEPNEGPTPIVVGSHAGFRADECSIKRALVGGGGVSLSLDATSVTSLLRFGREKCRVAASAGRWINVAVDSGHGTGCSAPMCSAENIDAVLPDSDSVRVFPLSSVSCRSARLFPYVVASRVTVVPQC
jgi:hypothetical protein